MGKDKLMAASLGGSADEVEQAFYEALQAGDIDRLMACWSDDEDIVCIHPGGPRLLGAAAIRATFGAMFANGVIQAKPEHVRKVESLTSAMHNLVEVVVVHTPEGPRKAYVTASNVYHRTAQGWRMVLHHASPGSQKEQVDIEELPQVLH